MPRELKERQVVNCRPRKFNTPEELQIKIKEYFDLWAEQKRPITVVGMCVYLGIGKSTLYDYYSGRYDTELQRFSDTIEEARLYIENDKLEKGLLGIYRAEIVKFDLLNNHGYTMKTENTVIDGEKNKEEPVNLNPTEEQAFETYKRLIKDL